MNIQDSLDNFIEYQEAKGNSAETVIYYKGNIGRFVQYAGDIEVEDITIKLLRDYVEHLKSTKKHQNNMFYPDDKKGKISSISVQTYVRAIRIFMGWLYKEEFITINFLPILPLPKAKKKIIEIISNEDICKINKTFDLNSKNGCRNACIFSLMIDSGLRLGEVAGLCSKNIDFKESTVKVLGKGNKERIVPFGYETKKRLYKYINNYRDESCSDNVFLSEDRPITGEGIKNVFKRISKNIGVSVHPHLLRHTFATRFIMAGGNLFTLQSILGHTTLEMVKRYSHLSDTHNRNKARQFSIMDNLFVKKASGIR